MLNVVIGCNNQKLADHVANLLKDKENLYKMMNEPVLATPISEKFKLFEDPPSNYYKNMIKYIKENI